MNLCQDSHPPQDLITPARLPLRSGPLFNTQVLPIAKNIREHFNGCPSLGQPPRLPLCGIEVVSEECFQGFGASGWSHCFRVS